jgi:hypothetical protein
MKYLLADAFQLRSDMAFSHVGQSFLFFNMFVLVLLHIWQKLHTQFLKFLPPAFLMGLEMIKEKSKKMNLKTRKYDLNCCFSTDFELFYHFGKLEKISFQKINRLIVSLINRFFVNFSSIFMVLAWKTW